VLWQAGSFLERIDLSLFRKARTWELELKPNIANITAAEITNEPALRKMPMAANIPATITVVNPQGMNLVGLMFKLTTNPG
jgi:hypothetical protein